MASSGFCWLLIACVAFLSVAMNTANGAEIDLEWIVSFDTNQSVITINGKFPGPLINSTTNDFIRVNVYNDLDEPLLFTWNGIQQRLNSWQDGVSGTNCPIEPGTNWTYAFQTKDQIGSFFYFPSINFQKAGGGYGPIRVNNRNVINVPFPKPEAEFDLLIGDQWFDSSYKELRKSPQVLPDSAVINGKVTETFTVTKGKTYRFRISNAGTSLSYNFRIQNHTMVLVETEGSYTKQITLESLDVHIGQSYSVLVTADQDEGDYHIVATPKLVSVKTGGPIVAKGVLHYANSGMTLSRHLPSGPDPFDIDFSVNQAKSIRWNMTTGAARPNPQGTFNVTNVTIAKTFILEGSVFEMDGSKRYLVNNVSYLTPSTPLKLADYLVNGTGVYQLDAFPSNSVNDDASYGVSVVSGINKGWHEIIFYNGLDVMDSWHLDGYGFYVVGFGEGKWSPASRISYNLLDPVVRSTVQVYPKMWTAVYSFLDNPGMWNLRSQHLKHWYLGEELYIRVYNGDPNPAKEKPAPENLLLCGIFDESMAPAPAPEPADLL